MQRGLVDSPARRIGSAEIGASYAKNCWDMNHKDSVIAQLDVMVRLKESV